MALTQVEKDILGYMVDSGLLKGESRVAVGASDELAREKISEFVELNTLRNNSGRIARKANLLVELEKIRKEEIEEAKVQTLINQLSK